MGGQEEDGEEDGKKYGIKRVDREIEDKGGGGWRK